MKYFDAHAHIQFPQYDLDRIEVLSRMEEAEVGGLVVGVDYESSCKAIELVEGKQNLWATVGLHPNDVETEQFNISSYDDLLKHPKVVGVGECGLDYYRPNEPEEVKKKQKDVLEQHIELAVKHGKTLMIHSRPSKGTQDAYQDTIDILTSKKREYGDALRGDMHFFVGGVDEAREFVNLDFSLSYTAVITFAREYDEVIRFIPLSHLLTETDSPYVAPAPNRGKRNEPLAVRDVVAAIAKIREEPEEVVRGAILENALRIFNLG